MSAILESSSHLGGVSFSLRVRRAGGAPTLPAPGQFAMLRPPDGAGGVFLGRPLSYLDAVAGGEDAIETYYVKTVGPGTRALVALPAGSAVDLLGPFGTGFPSDDPPGPLWLVGGGVGIAPLGHLLFERARPGRDATARTTLFYGGRIAGDLPFLEELGGACDELVTTTEDGTHGLRGRVTDALAPALAAHSGPPPTIYTCGPTPMMAAVAELAASHGAPCLASLETRMACGFGVCLGCAVHVEGQGYVRACVEGPVLDASKLDFSERWL